MITFCLSSFLHCARDESCMLQWWNWTLFHRLSSIRCSGFLCHIYIIGKYERKKRLTLECFGESGGLETSSCRTCCTFCFVFSCDGGCFCCCTVSLGGVFCIGGVWCGVSGSLGGVFFVGCSLCVSCARGRKGLACGCAGDDCGLGVVCCPGGCWCFSISRVISNSFSLRSCSSRSASAASVCRSFSSLARTSSSFCRNNSFSRCNHVASVAPAAIWDWSTSESYK